MKRFLLLILVLFLLGCKEYPLGGSDVEELQDDLAEKLADNDLEKKLDKVPDKLKEVVEEIEEELKEEQPEVTSMKALEDDDPVLGDENAPVTIIEWGDFECPFCGKFYREVYPFIKEEYIATGKAKLIYRDFPLTHIHANAQKAAEASECAHDQGKFWEMHDKIFEEGVEGGAITFKRYAQELELDNAEFVRCLDSGKHEEEVQKDLADGQALTIRGTPGVIINGVLIRGAQPYEIFKSVIEEQLRGGGS